MGLLDVVGRAAAAVRDRLSRAAGADARRLPAPARQLPDVHSVITALRAAGAGMDAADGVRHFNEMYLRVTELVEEQLAGGYFTNREFLERLDVVFAQLYLDAVAAARAGEVVAQCWEPVFAARRAPRASIQFAVAGMNAHINHDLAVALVETCRQLGINPRSRSVRADYDRVSILLGEVHEQVRQSFFSGVVLAADREASPLLNLVGTWSIARARDAAWTSAQVLWELRHTPELQESFRLTLSRTVGLSGRGLLCEVA